METGCHCEERSEQSNLDETIRAFGGRITSTSVMTLIAGPAAVGLLPDILAALARELPRADAPDWLAAGVACDVPLRGVADETATAAARSAIGDAAVDVLVQPADGRRKRVLVADLESTIIENEMLDELADFLGLRDEVAAITSRAMNGELDFVAALEARVALLRGMDAARLDEAAGRIRVTPGAAALVATMRANGAAAVLVSGGFRVFTAMVREALGFDADIANDLLVADGRITGEVGRPIVTRDTKLECLKRFAAERGIGLAATAAVGDGANDLPMLLAAGIGVAFRAKPAVAAATRVRIDHADLTALLYAQGYRDGEIVRPPARRGE
jgi:phosphoserine phosphatase